MKLKKLAGLTVAMCVCLSSITPMRAEAKLISDTDCYTYESKAEGDKSGESFKITIDNDKKTFKVQAATRNEYSDYGLYIYKGYHFVNRQLGSFREGKTFTETLDIRKLYSQDGEYLFRMNFGKDASEISGGPFTFPGLRLVSRNGKVYIERYKEVEEQNAKIRKSGAKVLPENYLDKTMKDSFETDYGEDLTAGQVKTMTAFGRSLVTKADAITNYDKAIAFHDFIGQTYEYDWDGRGNGHGELNPYKLYLRYKNGGSCKTICNGYAAYFVMLCRSQGIPARTVKGKSISLEKEGWAKYETVSLEYDHIWAEAYLDADGNGAKEWIMFDCDGDSITRGYQYTHTNPSLQSMSTSRLYLSYRETDATYMRPVLGTITGVSNGIKLGWKSGVVKLSGVTLTAAQKNNVKGYVIYRGTKTSNIKKIKTIYTTKNSYTYTDKTAKKGVTYYYKVAAIAKTDSTTGAPGLYRTIRVK